MIEHYLNLHDEKKAAFLCFCHWFLFKPLFWTVIETIEVNMSLILISKFIGNFSYKACTLKKRNLCRFLTIPLNFVQFHIKKSLYTAYSYQGKVTFLEVFRFSSLLFGSFIHLFRKYGLGGGLFSLHVHEQKN